jgi:hypothetical protein
MNYPSTLAVQICTAAVVVIILAAGALKSYPDTSNPHKEDLTWMYSSIYSDAAFVQTDLSRLIPMVCAHLHSAFGAPSQMPMANNDTMHPTALHGTDLGYCILWSLMS